MTRYYNADIKRTPDGDLELDGKDLRLTLGNDFLQQQIENRLGTSNPDWFLDSIGADLEDLLGEPNTKETGLRGQEMIMTSLTKDGMFIKEDIYIKAVPISKDEINYFVFINSSFSEEPVGYEISLHLSSGARIKKV